MAGLAARLLPLRSEAVAEVIATAGVGCFTAGVAVAVLRYGLYEIDVIINRRFNRRRYDAAKTVEAFSAWLREETDLATLSSELLRVVNQTMEPTTASLWLRPLVNPRLPR